MKIPDLAAELAYWVPRMGLDAPPHPWAISMRYESNPRPPSDPEKWVWGYCNRSLSKRIADIVIRTPTCEADCLEALDTIAHELLHCLQAPAEAPVDVEEGIVGTLAPLLTQLRTSDPARAATLFKAMTKAPIVARKGQRMDPEKIKAIIAALKEGNGEAALTLLEGLLTDAVAVGAPAPMTEATEPPKEPGTLQQPALGTDKPTEEKPMYKPQTGITDGKIVEGTRVAAALPAKDPELVLLKAKLEEDRAAAVDAVLDVHPQLSAEQRARFRQIGVEHGVATLHKDLKLFAPSAVIKPEGGPRLGLPSAPRGGSGAGAEIQSSGDQKMQTLFRIQQRDPNNTGVSVPKDGSALVQFSVVDAYAKIKSHAVARAFGAKTEGAK